MKTDRGVNVRLKGVHKVRIRGMVYFYAWRGGPRLCGDPAKDEAAAAQFFAEKEKRKALPTSNLIAALAIQYRNGPTFGGRSEKWKAEKNRFLDLIVEEFGEDDIAAFENARMRKDILEFRDGMAGTPRKADHVIGELSAFLNWAKDRGLVSKNLAEHVEKIGIADRAGVIWTAEEIDAVCGKAGKDIARAVRLAALTGLARVDLLALRWSDIKPSHIGPVERKKTGKLATIPRYAKLDALLAEIPKRAITVLTNGKGAPWSPDGFSTGFRRAKIKAEIDKRFHDFRGTAATFFYLLGFDDAEVADFLGWDEKSVRQIRKRYVTPAALAAGRVIRLQGRTKEEQKV